MNITPTNQQPSTGVDKLKVLSKRAYVFHNYLTLFDLVNFFSTCRFSAATAQVFSAPSVPTSLNLCCLNGGDEWWNECYTPGRYVMYSDRISQMLASPTVRKMIQRSFQHLDGVLHYEWMNQSLRRCTNLKTLCLRCPDFLMDEGSWLSTEKYHVMEEMKREGHDSSDFNFTRNVEKRLFEQPSVVAFQDDRKALEREMDAFKFQELFSPQRCPNLRNLSLRTGEAHFAWAGADSHGIRGFDRVLEEIAKSMVQHGDTALLESLDLRGCRHIGDKSFMSIVRACRGSLKHVYLTRSGVSSSCFEEFFTLCPGLQTLHIGEADDEEIYANHKDARRNSFERTHFNQRTEEDVELLCKLCPDIVDLDLTGMCRFVTNG